MRIKSSGFTLVVLSLSLVFGMATAARGQTGSSWVAPEAARKVKNPVKVTKEGLASATQLYRTYCVTCHGANGAGDGPSAGYFTPPPADFTDAKMMSKQTDGALFWKITTGRGDMPPWKNQFSATERWELVNYLRTFTKKAAATKDKKQTNQP